MSAGTIDESRARLFRFARNTVLRAGAGTGKTEALTTLYLHLVGGLADPEVWGRQGVQPERVVALTFTEKAALEMRERIAEAVHLLALEALPSGLSSLDASVRERAARHWGSVRGLSQSVVQRVLALADSAVTLGRPLPSGEVWQRVGFALGRARIGTFHGFAAGMLRSAALDIGLDPSFRVIEQEEADRLLRAATLAALSHAARKDVAAVVDLMATAGGVDADADHGLVALIADLVRALEEKGFLADELGVRPVVERVGVQTFMAAETLARFAAACEKTPSLREDGSARRMADLAASIAALGGIETPEQARRCADLLARNPLPGRTRTRRFEALAEETRAAIEALHDASLAILSERLAMHARAVVADAQRRFREQKAQRSVLDFSDLMHRLRDALRDDHRLRRVVKQRFDAVLVDEFQDTSAVQRDLLYFLRERRDRERIVGRGDSLEARDLEPAGLLLVGDAKQSIYAFRNADVSVFLTTERDLAEAGGARLELTDSYRSLDTVIEAINPVSEALLGSGLIAHGESMYDPARDALMAAEQGDGKVRVELLFVPGGRADEVRGAEARAIARRIKTLVEAPGPFAPGWRAPRYDDVAVLIPSWSHLEPLKKALNEQSIPYALLGGPGFWERREVDDLVVLLRFVADPSDRLALASVLRGPLVGLSDAALAYLFARPATLDDLLDPPAQVRQALDADDRARLDEARPTLRRLVRFGATLGPEAVLRLALAERAYAAVLANLPFAAQKVANVDKLVGLAAAAERRGGEESDVAGFVRYVDRMRAAAQREAEADVSDVAKGAVQILSIHAAKGLEWPVVFVAQTSRRRMARSERVLIDKGKRFVALPAGFSANEGFKTLRQDMHAAEDDDQRRLLYVALTRGRDLVVVSGPREEGEGDWRSLSMALLREVPARVRVLAPGEQGPAIPVRADASQEPEQVPSDEVLAQAIDPPLVPRRRLSLLPSALQEFERCPRRYFSLYEIGLDEHPRVLPGAPVLAPSVLLAALKDLLAAVDPGALTMDPEGALSAAAGALGAAHARSALAEAEALARPWVRSPLGEAVARGGALARALPVALALGEGERSVTLYGRVDLVLRGETLGREGLVVVEYALGPAAAWGDAGAASHSLVLEAWRSALARRFAAEGGEPPVIDAAVAFLSSQRAELSFLEPRHTLGKASLEQRVLGLGDALAEGRASARWEGRQRYLCERLRCGFVPRCHGG